MDRITILETIKKTNPWHKNGQVSSDQIETFKRKEFFEVRNRLTDFSMAELVVGARRVGKSVLMYQLIQHLLDAGTEAKHILFIQGDNPLLREIETDKKILNEILDLYQEFVLQESFSSLSTEVYIFVDEAHNLDGWQLEVKTLIDLKPKVKFFVTGSSSSELRRGSDSPLVGRVNVEVLPPFTFLDIVRFGLKSNDIKDDISSTLIKTSAEFRDSMLRGDIKRLHQAASVLMKLSGEYRIRRRFDQYLFGGGFPYALSQRPEKRARYLRDLLTMTISKDILSKVEIREPQAFERLIVNLCLSVGSKVSFGALADKIGIDERSVVKYVDYYLESHWVNVSSSYSFTPKQKSVKTDKKIYILDGGIINVLSFKEFREIQGDKTYRGHLVENAIYNHLLAWKQSLMGPFQNEISYWYEEGSNREIDFVVEILGGVVPIECKSKSVISDQDVEPILFFLKKRPSSKLGVITTDDDLLVKDNILYIPNWLLTLAI